MKLYHLKIFFPLLLLLFCNAAFSKKDKTADSLLNLLQTESNEEVQVILYAQLSKAYIQSNIDSAITLANKGLYIAKKIEFNKGIGDTYTVLGHIKVVQNDLFQAMEYYEKAAIAFKNSPDKVGLAVVYLVLGNVFYTISNYPEALNYYQMGVKIADSINYVQILPDFYNNMGSIYGQLQNYEASIANYQKGLVIKEDANDKIGKAMFLQNLGSVYAQMDNFNKARAYLDEAYQIYSEIYHNEGLMNVSRIYASFERMQGNYEKAIKYYNKGFQYFQKIGPDYFGPTSQLEAELFLNIGYCYLMIKNYNLSEEYLIKGYTIAERTGILEYIGYGSQNLSELYELTNQPIKALKYARLFKMYSDSLSKDENIKKLTQLEMQFDFDKKLKEQEIEQSRIASKQKRKELIYIMISSSTLLALIILFLLFRLQKYKVKKIELEKKTLIFDLDYKNKELTTNVMYLLKKNEFIMNISDKLKKSRYDFKPETRKIVDDIIREIEHSSTEGAWTDFEIRFQEVHAGFYQKLNDKFPDLSPNELKLCAFLRLNMSTKEISTITFQSPKSISMARFRLRKKMGVGSYENLITYLNQL